MELEKALEHLSNTYNNTEHECKICLEIIEVFDKYKFNLPEKTWDRDT